MINEGFDETYVGDLIVIYHNADLGKSVEYSSVVTSVWSRIFYFSFEKNTFILLNGFVKKSDKTPERELEKARKYKNDYERRCKDE